MVLTSSMIGIAGLLPQPGHLSPINSTSMPSAFSKPQCIHHIAGHYTIIHTLQVRRYNAQRPTSEPADAAVGSARSSVPVPEAGTRDSSVQRHPHRLESPATALLFTHGQNGLRRCIARVVFHAFEFHQLMSLEERIKLTAAAWGWPPGV